MPTTQPLTIEANWRRALTVKKAPYVTFLGHDDVLRPSFLARIDGLTRTRPNATLFATGFHLIDEHDQPLRSARLGADGSAAADYLRGRLRLELESLGCGFAMRSDTFDQVGGFPAYPRLLFADDLLAVRLLKTGTFAVDTHPACSRRLRTESISSSAEPETFLLSLHLFLTDLKAHAVENAALVSVLEAEGCAAVDRDLRTYLRRALVDATRSRRRSTVTAADLIDALTQVAPTAGACLADRWHNSAALAGRVAYLNRTRAGRALFNLREALVAIDDQPRPATR